MLTEVLKACLHGAIATAIYSSQLIGFLGFSVIATIVPCEYLH